MANKNELMMIFSAKSENESFARNAVAAFLAKLNPSIEEINDIKTAVSEAVTNSIVHGYECSEGEISIHVSIDGYNVKIVIIDYGVGIENVEIARQPFFSTKANEDRSGMGFTVMESIMDSVEVESCGVGVTVIMTKEISHGDEKITEKETSHCDGKI